MNPEDWLNQAIYVGTLDMLRRRTMIWRFTKYGLEPFLKANGYALHGNTSTLSSGIASLLFHNRDHTLICPYAYGVNEHNDYSSEHKQHYNHVIDYKAWEKFWEEWGMWEDVSLDFPYGFYRRIDIQEYIWSEVNLAMSSQTRIVEEHIDGYTYEEGYGHRDDVEES
jgi:hypothetical protein